MEQTQTVTITENCNTNLSGELKKITTGSLFVSSNVAYSSVYIDGKYVGFVGKYYEVMPGIHQVKITYPGYKDDMVNVTVKSGEIKSAHGFLRKTKAKKKEELFDYPNEGVRCLLEAGIGGGIGYNYTLFETNAIVGYQICPMLFVGSGVSLHCYMDVTYDAGYYYSESIGDIKNAPIFLYARYDMIDAGISPFFDINLGLVKGDLEGKYYAFACGVRFYSVNVVLGMEFEQHDISTIEWKGNRDDPDFLSVVFRVSLDIGARKR